MNNDNNVGGVAIESTQLLDAIHSCFVVALDALCPAATYCGIIGFNPTKQAITEVVIDLRKAIDVINSHRSNAVNHQQEEVK